MLPSFQEHIYISPGVSFSMSSLYGLCKNVITTVRVGLFWAVETSIQTGG